MSSIKDLIRTIPDFPIPGIMFRDVTSLFDNAKGFGECIEKLVEPYRSTKIDKIIGLEARGFIIGGAIARELDCGFVPIRKVGKLPGKTITQDYELEYGKATLEIHEDAISAGDKILIVDDLLATGGTAEAGISLVEKLGGEILACAFIINLPDLGGSKKLENLEFLNIFYVNLVATDTNCNKNMKQQLYFKKFKALILLKFENIAISDTYG